MDICGVGLIQIPRRKRVETMVQGDIRCQLEIEQVQIKKGKFNGKSINEALNSRPTIIPENQWRNAVQF